MHFFRKIVYGTKYKVPRRNCDNINGYYLLIYKHCNVSSNNANMIYFLKKKIFSNSKKIVENYVGIISRLYDYYVHIFQPNKMMKLWC